MIIPILKPDLDRAFGHVDILRDPLSHNSCGGRILVELRFQSHQLILRGPLALLVLLLLSEGAFARRSTRGGVAVGGSVRHGRGSNRHVRRVLNSAHTAARPTSRLRMGKGIGSSTGSRLAHLEVGRVISDGSS